jgi:ribonucleoside-triphosphate reductase
MNQSISVSDYQQFIYLSRYSRFLHEENRRETWPETVARYFDFFKIHLKETCGFNLTKEMRYELEHAVLQHQVMPSMRCLMTAGPALERDNICGYNCSYLPLDSAKAFSELMYILLNGTGDGFSVERQLYVNKLPTIPESMYPTDTTIIVGDSKLGWAKALNELISLLYTGYIPKWDVSKLRPAGSILKTFGGRASGPEPLVELFKFIIAYFEQHKGQKLTSLACHDIACMIGNCVVVGGVRRSALISLSDLDDAQMRGAKSGQWWTLTPYRRIANNSAVYKDKRPDMSSFIDEWKSLYDSKSGERGLLSRYAAKQNIERSNAFRLANFDKPRLRDTDWEFGTNPCSEINLRPNQFCNLTETVIRATDDIEMLKKKVELATILGTFQSTLTNFKFISKKWTDNTEEERLLGVSLTGIMDNQMTNGCDMEMLKYYLTELRKTAIHTNAVWAKKLGIPQSVAITAVKPSGTVSQLVNSSSGIHARHADYYLRSVRNNKRDPISNLMIDAGFPHEEDRMSPSDWVFSFPVKSPSLSIKRHDMDALRQLEIWKMYQLYWTEHKPSVTVSVREEEWMKVGSWVFDNFEHMSGISFLPMSDHVYQQAPYQDLTKEEYGSWLEKMPSNVDWSRLAEYEKTDETTGSQELACAAGCELV